MRIVLTVILIFFLFIESRSFGQSNSNSAFGAVSFKYSSILNHSSVIAGGRFGWVINKSIVLGAGYYSLVSNVKTYLGDNSAKSLQQVNLTYGGLEFEYIFLPEKPIHFSVSALFAGGGLYFTAYDKTSTNYYGIDMLVWEPAFNLEIKALQWMHIDMDLSYRFIGNFHENYGLTENDVRGIASGITLKFGSF